MPILLGLCILLIPRTESHKQSRSGGCPFHPEQVVVVSNISLFFSLCLVLIRRTPARFSRVLLPDQDPRTSCRLHCTWWLKAVENGRKRRLGRLPSLMIVGAVGVRLFSPRKCRPPFRCLADLSSLSKLTAVGSDGITSQRCQLTSGMTTAVRGSHIFTPTSGRRCSGQVALLIFPATPSDHCRSGAASPWSSPQTMILGPAEGMEGRRKGTDSAQ